MLLAATLGGCGKGEDFAVQAAAKPAAIMAQLHAVRWDNGRMVFGDLPVRVERPGEGQIVWAFQFSLYPGDKGQRGEIALRLEPVDQGKHTVIHGTINLPEVPVMMGEANQVLSENKVEDAVRQIVTRLAKHLEKHISTSGDVSEMGQAITAIAVIADFRTQARANEFKRHPEKLDGLAEGLYAAAMEKSQSDDDQDEDAGYASDTPSSGNDWAGSSPTEDAEDEEDTGGWASQDDKRSD